MNNDGVNDVYYEVTKDGYYELLDMNFDGRIDQMHFYDLGDNLLRSKYDQDYDGFLETALYYRNSSPVLCVVDVGNDGFYDIYFNYVDGFVSESVKYVSSNSNASYLEKYRYQYGHPVHMEKEVVDYSQEYFHLMVDKKVKFFD